jgi:hypothetical protein
MIEEAGIKAEWNFHAPSLEPNGLAAFFARILVP